MAVLNSSRYFDVFLCTVWALHSMLQLTCLIAFWSYVKDVHTELIQHKRAWMIKRGIVKGKLSVDSAEQRLQGLCPLMPEEVSKKSISYL